MVKRLLLAIGILIASGVFFSPPVLAQESNDIFENLTSTSGGELLGQPSILYKEGNDDDGQPFCPDGSQCYKYKWSYDVWQALRQFSNILIVLFLFMASVATTLNININTYGVKRILPSLIVGALLANFSYFIADILLAVDQALRNAFLAIGSGAKAPGQVTNLVDAKAVFNGLRYPIGVLLENVAKDTVSWLDLFKWFLNLTFGSVALLGLWLLVLLLYIRNIIIGFLVALAPLAFITMAAPMTEGLFKKWWNEFIRWMFLPSALGLVTMIGVISISAVAPTAPFMGLVVLLITLYLLFKIPFMLGAAIGTVAGYIAGTAKPTLSRAALYMPGVSTAVRLKNQLKKNTEADIERLTKGAVLQQSGARRLAEAKLGGRFMKEDKKKKMEEVVATLRSGLAKRENSGNKNIEDLLGTPYSNIAENYILKIRREMEEFEEEYTKKGSKISKAQFDDYKKAVRKRALEEALDEAASSRTKTGVMFSREQLRERLDELGGWAEGDGSEWFNHLEQYRDAQQEAGPWRRFVIGKDNVSQWLNALGPGKEYRAQMLGKEGELAAEQAKLQYFQGKPELQALVGRINAAKNSVETMFGAIESQAEASALATNKLLRAERELARQRKVVAENSKKLIENKLALEGQDPNSALYAQLQAQMRPLLNSLNLRSLADAHGELGMRAKAAEEAIDIANKEAMYNNADRSVSNHQLIKAIRKGEADLDSLRREQQTELRQYLARELKISGLDATGDINKDMALYSASDKDFESGGVLEDFQDSRSKILGETTSREALFKRQRTLQATMDGEARDIQFKYIPPALRESTIRGYTDESLGNFLAGPVQLGHLTDAKTGQVITDSENHAKAMKEIHSVLGAQMDHIKAGALASGDDFVESARSLMTTFAQNDQTILRGGEKEDVERALDVIEKGGTEEEIRNASVKVQRILRNGTRTTAIANAGILSKSGHGPTTKRKTSNEDNLNQDGGGI